MTAAEVAGILAKAGWAKSTGGTSEGFRVAQRDECVIVSWVSPSWNAKTVTRMLRNYKKTLEGHDVTQLRSHLIVK